MKTLYDKLWDDHVVEDLGSGDHLVYIDRHFLHEVTSPQAFDGISKKNLKPWRLAANIATPDHNVPTARGQNFELESIEDEVSKIQIIELDRNCNKFDIPQFDINSEKQGIVHVVGPENGFTLPGMTIVCGDSHTSTHGAFAALSMGIGTSEVEHVLATQCLRIKKLKNFRINLLGCPRPDVTSKDVILYVIRSIGTDGGTGHAIEFSGDYISSLSMESRMTICNMSIEAGAKVGLIAFDKITESYLSDKVQLDENEYDKALEYWKSLSSDSNAKFDKEIEIDVSKIKPQVSWGTSPEMTSDYDSCVPELDQNSDKYSTYKKAIEYMGLKEREKLSDLTFNKVFVGSCTNSRIEDLRSVAAEIKDKRISESIEEALIVPGSGQVKLQAEKEGLDKIFIEAGFSWRDPGCSMCLGMNEDKLSPGDRCASTSNRNFEGRQGHMGRTHLVSPMMAARIAIHGGIPHE